MAAADSTHEFIDDRSIEDLAEDQFRHEDVVEELAHLILSCKDQANIALFAPWGSGKTGISKLLRSRLRAGGGGRRYVYFDAFKHKDTSLRRSFLRAVAAELGKDPSDIDTLSREEVTQRLDSHNGWKLALFVFGALVIGIAFMAIVSLPLAAIRPESKGEAFWTSFALIFTRLSGIATLVAALLGVVVTGLLGGLTVTRRKNPLSEDDEFEDAFKELARSTGQLIVFVDELDRCGANEVVATLETMRVFLEVKNCVFVVAADRQALEQAIRRKARQETPADDIHAYFSSAGAYIDKIFQFQISLPPLRWTDTGQFAEELVQDKGGLWKDLREWGELQDVLAALVPTHVTSPRRVKVLLNAYVIEHRLAQRRVAAHEMSGLQGRAAALAQLVCLRAEFPFFADELERYPDLPTAVLAIEHPEFPRGEGLEASAPETWARAKALLDGELLAPLLHRTDGADESDSDHPDPESTGGSRAHESPG